MSVGKSVVKTSTILEKLHTGTAAHNAGLIAETLRTESKIW